MSVCGQIKKLRLEAGLSQYDLANRINGFNQSQISKIEKGTRKLHVEELTSVAKALGVDVSKLLE